jgi:hypothetical protein
MAPNRVKISPFFKIILPHLEEFPPIKKSNTCYIQNFSNIKQKTTCPMVYIFNQANTLL